MEAVAAARDDVCTAGFEESVLSDVRQLVWELALCDTSEPPPEAARLTVYLARKALALARVCLDGLAPCEPDAVDPWACLRAALLDVDLVRRLPGIATRGDAVLFDRLSRLLAPPADVVCRDLASELRDVA